MGGPSDKDEVPDVPEEYWDTPQPGESRKLVERIKFRHIATVIAVMAVVASGIWAVLGGPLSHRVDQSRAVFAPYNASNASSVALPPSSWPSIPVALTTQPSASASSAPADSSPAVTAPVASSPAATVSASTVSKSASADTGPCAGEGTWTTSPEVAYPNIYLINSRVVLGASKSQQCDTVWIFSVNAMPSSMLNAHVGARIMYVSQALTDIPGRTGDPVTVNGRFILWLQVNAPAAGYEAGAPASEGRFRPGDHMTNADGLKKYFSEIRDLVFLGSDQHSSFYAFGLDTQEPFKLWVHLNSRHQVEWALKIAHE